MDFLTIKSLHIIFVVTWFAGLFYIVRLFVYLRETIDRPENEKSVLFPQLALMAQRLWYGITWPSSVLAIGFGVWLVVIQPEWLSQPFMHVKLAFVGLLLGYQFVCQRLYARLTKQEPIWTSMKLRLWNELATLVLVAIVFLIVRKNVTDWLYGTFGLVIFAALLMLAIRIYKRFRA